MFWTNVTDAMPPHVTLVMFFYCPRLLTFWTDFVILSGVLGVQIRADPLIAIFAIPTERLCVGSLQSEVLAFTSLLARRRILLMWKSHNPPSISVWLKDVMFFIRLEKITKEKLKEVQEQLNRPVMKFIQEVDTHWNSTFLMLQRLFQERQAVGAALATLTTDVTPMSSEDYEATAACLHLLAPLQPGNRFTVSTFRGEKSVSVQGHSNYQNVKYISAWGDAEHKAPHSKTVGTEPPIIYATKKNETAETQTALTLATLLDPIIKYRRKHQWKDWQHNAHF